MAAEGTGPGMSWLAFALMTVFTWGLYGLLLHTGQMGMADSVSGRWKAFLFVGIAYFLTAVVAPLVILTVTGADWSFPAKGMSQGDPIETSKVSTAVDGGVVYCIFEVSKRP